MKKAEATRSREETVSEFLTRINIDNKEAEKNFIKSGYKSVDDIICGPPLVQDIDRFGFNVAQRNKIMKSVSDLSKIEDRRPLKRRKTFSKAVEIEPVSLLNFLKNQARIYKINSFRILSPQSLAFGLQGREDAIQMVVELFLKIQSQYQKEESERTSDRTQLPIPVCSGIPGLGKTRMLEEWEMLLDKSQIVTNRLGVIVPYFNGHNIQPIEDDLPIQASFSWRLLHRLFVDNNHIESFSFEEWFTKHLPENAADLTIRDALKVVYLAAVDTAHFEYGKTLTLFVGIDEYQSIKKINQTDILNELLDALGAILAQPEKHVVLLPMFAGTDLDALGSLANSSNTLIKKIHMPLLLPSETRNSIAVVGPRAQRLLTLTPVLRHLFYLGGVPRYGVFYCEEIMKKFPDFLPKNPPPKEDLQMAYGSVCGMWMSKWGSHLKPREIITIVAHSLSGRCVSVDGTPIRTRKWRHLRDSSVCLLEEEGDKYRVMLPYSVLRHCSNLGEQDMTTVEKCFINTLKDLTLKLDEQVFDIEPWKLWEKFGAYFHACRINALQIIGDTVVPFTDICSGALIHDCTERVQLQPVVVFETCMKYGEDMSEFIGEVGYPQKLRNWVLGDNGIGYIVINATKGKGVDIFFALPREVDGFVVCVDQRKRITATQANSFLDKTDIVPRCVRNPLLIKGLFNMFPWYNNSNNSIPKNSFLVCYNQTKKYHGCLSLHPISSPCINVNQDLQTAIQNFERKILT